MLSVLVKPSNVHWAQVAQTVSTFCLKNTYQSGLSLRAGGRGFSPATKRVAPSYFYWKIDPQEMPSRLIPRLLVVFTRQLEILVTTLTSGPGYSVALYTV